MDLSVGLGNLQASIDNRKATDYDTQTVSFQYIATDGSIMETTLVPGSPYMTFKFTNAQPILKSMNGNINFMWDVAGKKGRMTARAATYLLYVIDGSLTSFTQDKTTLTFSAGFTGTIRLAYLAKATQESILDDHQGTYATSVTMAYNIENDVSTQTWTWDVVGDSAKLLIMSWPHHRNRIVAPSIPSHESSLDLIVKERNPNHILFTKMLLDKVVAGRCPAATIFGWTMSAGHCRLANVVLDIVVLDHVVEPVRSGYPSRKVLMSPAYVDIEYMNMKGIMKGVVGNKWTLKHALPAVKWSPTLPPDASCLAELVKTLEYEVKALIVEDPGDFYVWGNHIAATAKLALIADSLGRVDLVERVVDILKQSYNFWFIPGRSQGAAYETKWGGVVSLIGGNNNNYNDHHKMYGYFIYGAVVIGKYDPAWLTKNIDFVTHIVRDIGNPSPDDPFYPVSRHFDFFTGHSWASGLGNGAGPRNQESISEAINAYYALGLYADVTNNAELMKWARLLIAMEIDAAQTYWHLYPNDKDSPYPEKKFRDLITAANIYAFGAGAYVQNGAQYKIEVAAIVILPLTVMGETLYDKEWIKNALPYCSNEILSTDPKYADKWKSVIIAAYARFDPQKAYKYSTQLTSWGSGNTATNQLYFVSTQASTRGAICTPTSTPEGLFYIQDVKTGNYVRVVGNNRLKAAFGSLLLATKINLAFIPGGGTIQATSNGKYVTANSKGSSPLVANQQNAGSQQVFQWLPVGNGYQLKAMVNKVLVSTGTDAELINKAGVTPGQYRVVPADPTAEIPPLVPRQGKIQSLSTSRFVVVTKDMLVATEIIQDKAATFSFEKVANSELFVIRSDNGKFVTANPKGTSPLAATAGKANAYEQFRFLKQNQQWVVVHEHSGMAVAVQMDGTLLNNDTKLGPLALFRIV